MKRARQIAALGMAVVAAASVTQASNYAVAAAPAPVKPAAEDCAPGAAADARVRSGSHAHEPEAHVDAKTAAQVELDLSTTAGLTALRAANGWISMPVYFHVLHNGTKGNVSKKTIEKQIAVLDATFRGQKGGANVKVNFWLKSITRTNNKTWYNNPVKYASTYKKKLRKGGDSSLNIYSGNLGSELLGYATFPWQYKKAPKLDGVVVHTGSLPGGAIKNYNLGYTAVHEVGHWLGLYHTFGREYPKYSGCKVGDGVNDTPPEADPANGCPAGQDTCPAAGADPIHNFMDYSHDSCMTQFTKGQGVRIHAAWNKYRP